MKKNNSTRKLTFLVSGIIICICWTSVILGFLFWQIHEAKETVLKLATVEAEASFNKDLVYRRWSTMHGGTYVPVTKHTPPNPYLVNVENREIITPSGKTLTLVNPAYMTRQVHQLAGKQYGVKGHITSLNPIRPENKPDPWEEKALLGFEKGISEAKEIRKIEGTNYLRLMLPMFTEKGCLKCHGYQGYAEGDIRGGISVSVPLKSYQTIANAHIRNITIFHVLIIIIGIVGLAITFFHLNKIETYMRSIFRVAPTGIGVISNRILSQVNDKFCEMLGYSKDELVGQNARMIYFTDEEYEFVGKEKYKQITLSGTGTVETEFRCKDGKKIDVLLSSTPLKMENLNAGVTFTALDITLMKNAQAALKSSEVKYRTMMETINDFVYISSDDYRIQYMNKAMSDRVGYDAIGDLCYKALHGFDNICPWCKYEEIVKTGHVTKDITSPKDNKSFNISSTLFKNEDGSTSKLAVFRDTTELIELQNNLQQAQKMEAIGTLSGGIAHDFNNILFPIMGHTEMIMSELSEDDPIKDSMEQIYSASIRAKDLVQQILTFSRQTKSDLQLISIQYIAKEVLKLIRHSIPTTIEIQDHINSKSSPIYADPTQIHQIIMNLITNAYHAMEDTVGKLKVSLNDIELSKSDIFDPEMKPGQYVCLSISDTGTGISDDIKHKIFDPFFTTKKEGKGTGMGLSVVHGIVKSAGGGINIHSELGKGSEFKLYFPVAKESIKDENEHKKESKLQIGTERILLVDDEDFIINAETKMLIRMGYKVFSRTSSVEALEAFKSNPHQFDLVISDVAMPKLPGDRFATELLKIRPDIPIILCTGFSDKVSAEKAKLMGIKGFLLKPVVLTDLSNMIRKVLDENKES